DLESAHFFLKNYLAYRREAVKYLNEHLEDLTYQLVDIKNPDRGQLQKMIEAFEVLGPDYAPKLNQVFSGSIKKWSSLYPELELRYQRVLNHFDVLPRFNTGEDLTHLLRFLKDKKLIFFTPQSPHK